MPRTALYQALADWGDDLRTALATTDQTDPAARFEAMWTQVIRSFAQNHRLWAVQFELLGFLDRKTGAEGRFRQGQRGGPGRAGRVVRGRG